MEERIEAPYYIDGWGEVWTVEAVKREWFWITFNDNGTITGSDAPRYGTEFTYQPTWTVGESDTVHR